MPTSLWEEEGQFAITGAGIRIIGVDVVVVFGACTDAKDAKQKPVMEEVD